MKRKMTVVAGAAALALAASGCAGDRDPLAGPARAAEGRAVVGRLADVLEVPEASGPPACLELRQRGFESRIRRGSAVAEHGLVASVGGGQRLRVGGEFTDPATGRRHVVQAEREAGGAPFTRLVSLVDGRPFVEISREWRFADGLWVLADERATVHVGERQLRVSRTLADTRVAAARRRAPKLLAPPPLLAAEACWKEAVDYAAATLLLAGATELVLASPDKISAGLVWLAAWDNWRKALDAYARCMDGGSVGA